MKDILVSIVAIITPIIAIKGLFIWRDQLRGYDIYKLSKEILEKTFNLDDAMMSVRTPFVSSGELNQRESDLKINETETDNEKNMRNEAYALWKRTEPMFKTVSELKVLKFQAMALLGKDSVQDINSIIIKVYELRNAQVIYFQMKANPSLRDPDSMDKYWRIIYEMPKDKDSFKKEIDDMVLKIENKFRIYLE